MVTDRRPVHVGDDVQGIANAETHAQNVGSNDFHHASPFDLRLRLRARRSLPDALSRKRL